MNYIAFVAQLNLCLVTTFSVLVSSATKLPPCHDTSTGTNLLAVQLYNKGRHVVFATHAQAKVQYLRTRNE